MVQTGAEVVGHLTHRDRILIKGIRLIDVHRQRAPIPSGNLQTPCFGFAMAADACLEIRQRCPSSLDLGADSFQPQVTQALFPFHRLH